MLPIVFEMFFVRLAFAALSCKINTVIV